MVETTRKKVVSRAASKRVGGRTNIGIFKGHGSRE